MDDPSKVYVIGSSIDGPVKIGLTAMRIQHRINNLQPGNPQKLQSFGVRYCVVPWLAEQRAHEMLKDKRLAGEWFNVSAKEALATVDKAIKLTQNGRRMVSAGVRDALPSRPTCR